MTEFRLGIQGLTKALEKLAGSVDSGFNDVHCRLDKGEEVQKRLDKRLFRLELKNGIDPELHEG